MRALPLPRAPLHARALCTATGPARRSVSLAPSVFPILDSVLLLPVPCFGPVASCLSLPHGSLALGSPCAGRAALFLIDLLATAVFYALPWLVSPAIDAQGTWVLDSSKFILSK